MFDAVARLERAAAFFVGPMARSGGVWCMGTACPWCFLDAMHGDYSEALRNYADLLFCREMSDRPHLVNAAWHVVSDLIEQAERNGVDSGLTEISQPPGATETIGNAAVHPTQVGPRPSVQDLLTSTARSRNRAAGKSAASSWLGPERGAASSSSTELALVSAAAASAAVVPAIPAERAQFEVWGGKSTKWIPYDTEAQSLLQVAYMSKEKVRVRSAGQLYEVNTDPSCLQQVRADRDPGTECNVRRVRIVDSAGELDAMY